MFLKSIEIRGFKSFADKTDLIFKKGITAVVGPNGSGKSNISDAVRWVLGEQSVKSLRGGKMEDVIFAGTQFRKPVGLAQVSLTLDNSDGELPVDYSEVTISRRLYRSGESEYYINSTHCRLKDVQELFMDTGIGKEGYSIIGQGKIDAILNGKPEDRRSLLEEAAGIVKFKSRKDEAEKRLSNTEQNLIRICDILRTYEERLEPLRIESEKAKTFLILSEDLKSKEVNVIIQSIDNLQIKVENLKSVIENIKSDISRFNKEKDDYKQAVDNLNKRLEICEAAYKENQQSYYKHKSELQDLNSDTNILNERIKNLQALIEKNLNEISGLEEKLNSLTALKNSQEEALIELKNEQTELNSRISTSEDEIRIINSSLSEDEERLNRSRLTNTELLSLITNIKNNVVLLNSELAQFENKLEELKLSSENYMNSLKINSTTKVMLENNILKSDEKIKTYEEEVKKKRLEISRLTNVLQKDENSLKELNSALNKQEANYQMLTNLDKAYEGYNRASKILMQDIKVKKLAYAENKCFILGEVISVKKDLETAIEIALGGAISDIITTDETVAKALINYLKVNNIGRATFLPLNIVSGKKLASIEKLKVITGYLGVASELISYDLRFTNAVEHILGRTVIASDMDCALNIAKATSYSVRIVTLGGEVINPGGALTGGSIYHKSTSIIGRKREIEEIGIKIKENKLLIEELSSTVASNRTLVKEIDNSCLNLRDDIYFENIEKTKLNEKVSSIILENNKLTGALNISRDELRLIKEKISNFKNKIEIKNKELEETIKAEELNRSNIDILELELKNKNSSIINKKEKYTASKIKKAQLDEIVINKVRELERISNEVDELITKKTLILDEINVSKNSVEASTLLIDENTSKFQGINNDIHKFQTLFQDNEIEQIKLKDEIKSITENFDKLILLLNKKEEDHHRQELSLTRLEGEMEAFYLKLNEEIGLTYAEALKYKTTIDNLDKHKRDIAEIKSKIAALGIVNVGAVEEYKEVKEKYTFMNAQREDLTNAKTELTNMITEITIKMKDVFNENLNKLRVVFNETFKELFKGGSADLILGEGDELSANIEINVEPPGKKLQNINLMSGGEKVLSAIALLFAILKMKPTPFCILDEIEAALDDANVLRYAEFLNKFSGNIQFIIITHRKGTMEVGDVLYGVTMEEKGVSKIVSVDLSKQVVLT